MESKARKRQNSDGSENDLGTPSTSKNGPKKLKTTMMESLECPVCLKVPRPGAGPIYSCKNGHLLCKGCVDKIKDCPICREKEIHCRNLFAERYIEIELKDVAFPCKFIGCTVELPMTDDKLTKHEKFCPQREVICPASPNCNWKGSLNSLPGHAIGHNGICISGDEKWEQPASLTESTFTLKRSFSASAFEKSEYDTYQSIALLAKGFKNIWCYLRIERHSSGMWYFMVYCMLPKDCVDKINAKVSLQNSTRKYGFETKLLSFETTKDDAIKMGQYMCLQDAQVTALQTEDENSKDGRKLIKYNVKIEVDPEFLLNVRRRAQRFPVY